MAGRRERCGGSPDRMALNRGLILGLIYGYYKEALDALPLEDMPALAPRLLDAGVCFGFADPVTNIIANTVCFAPDEDGEPEPSGTRKRKRKRKQRRKTKANGSGEARTREDVLSKIVAGDVPNFPPRPVEVRTIAERSLEGLIAFLTSYFRYLPTRVALCYLHQARADLLVAVRLIEHGRCYRRKDEFDILSHATKTAIKCAALSARHPNVDVFIAGSFSLVSHLNVISKIVPVERRCRLSIQETCRLSGFLMEPLEPNKSHNPMKLAGLRMHTERVLPAPTESLRGVLLDRIHALYLKTISRIPMEDFRGRLHHGLLKAGYCYGPFSPVSNIIVNTIWYNTAFPAPQEFELDMICNLISTRLESRSLRGLIKLLLACIRDISEHDAMIYLLKSNLKISKSIRMARIDGHETSRRDVSAYKAAADASFHPEPEAYVDFVVQHLHMVRSTIKSLLQYSTLSSSEFLELSRLLSPSNCHPAKSLEPTIELTKDAVEMVSRYKENFFTQQSIVRRKVDYALRNYEQTKGNLYELRVICGVNEKVGTKKSFRDLKCPYSHVNFWASPKDGTSLILFFAQFSNEDEENENQEPFCCPVLDLSTNLRCCYCEFQGTRIVHPLVSYCGGAMDFEKIAWGGHKLDNAQIISHGELIACSVGIFGEDYIYFNPTRDLKFIRAMNRAAWRAKLDWGDEIRRIRQMDEAEVYKLLNIRKK